MSEALIPAGGLGASLSGPGCRPSDRTPSDFAPAGIHPSRVEVSPMSDRRIHWRCFHCGETFTKAQERWARQHFGADEATDPACLMRVPGEHHLLERLRKLEAEVGDYRAEDTDLHRALHAMSADHRQALIREEERGYEKGLRDGMALRASDEHPTGEDPKGLSGEAMPARSASADAPSDQRGPA